MTEETKAADVAPAGVSDSTQLLERLAELEHQQWWKWAENLMNTETHISNERIARWKDSMVPYSQLTEENKEHDRIWARKVLEIVRSNEELCALESAGRDLLAWDKKYPKGTIYNHGEHTKCEAELTALVERFRKLLAHNV